MLIIRKRSENEDEESIKFKVSKSSINKIKEKSSSEDDAKNKSTNDSIELHNDKSNPLKTCNEYDTCNLSLQIEVEQDALEEYSEKR